MLNTLISDDFLGPFMSAYISTPEYSSQCIITFPITYFPSSILILEHFELSNKNELDTYKYFVI